MIRTLKEKNAEYYTLQPRTEIKFKFVIKGLHPKLNIEYIKTDVQEKGHKVSNIINLIKGGTILLSMFLVEIEQANNNKDIYNTSIVCNTKVNIESPRTNREITQCARCQRYGHTKNYCNKQARCVKCAGTHPTENCPLGKKIDKVVCANCGNNHPANYKGCMVRKGMQKKLFPPIRDKGIQKLALSKTNTANTNTNVNTNINQKYRNSAEVLKPNNRHDTNEHESKQPIQMQRLEKLETLVENLTQQITVMLNLLSKLITL